jgi:hypothetical protein
MIREDKHKNKIASCLNVLCNLFKTPYVIAIYKILIQKKNFNSVEKERQCLQYLHWKNILLFMNIIIIIIIIP